MLEQIPPQDSGEEEVARDAHEGQRGNPVGNRPSTDFAALIDIIKAEGRANRGEEQSEDRGKRNREWITIFLLCVTVFAIGWQVHEMIKVYGPIRDQAQAEQKAADAAKISADAAKVQSVAATQQSVNSDKAVEESQRAWVGPTTATIDAVPTVGQSAVAKIAYQNTGKEPARNFVYFANPIVRSVASYNAGKLAPELNDYMAKCFNTPDRTNAGIAYPSTGFGGNTLNVTFDGKLVTPSIVSGRDLLLVQGCFVYRTFNQVHHSAFCLFYLVAQPVPGQPAKPPALDLYDCVTGNNAD